MGFLGWDRGRALLTSQHLSVEDFEPNQSTGSPQSTPVVSRHAAKGCRRLRHRWSREETSGPLAGIWHRAVSQPKAGRLAGGNAAHCQLLAAPAVPTALGDTHAPTGCPSPVLAHPHPLSSSHTALRASSSSSCTLTPKQPLGTPRSIAGGGEGR